MRRNQGEVATGAFIVKDGNVLLATGSKFSNLWTVPGGHPEFKEMSGGCVKREALEEVGLEVKPVKLFYTQEKIVLVRQNG